MFKIEIDKEKNLLILAFLGKFDNNQGIELYQNLQNDIRNLNAGFKLLTDLTQLEEMDLEAYESIDSIMELCNSHGVSKVIRVITKESADIGFNIISLFHYSHSVIIHTCRSLEEAERCLK